MPHYNPDRPLYQTSWSLPDCIAKTHPGLTIVTVPDKTDPAEAIRRMEMQRGADMMWYGMWISIACVVGHGVIKASYPLLKPVSRILEWGILGGVVTIIGGMLYKNVMEYEKIILLVVCVCGAGGLLYWKRDWSASHLFKRKPKNSSGTQSEG